jgi:hypothetical protein
MTHQFAPKTFLRQVPNYLLKEFFNGREQFSHIDWVAHKECEIGVIYDAWQALPEPERVEVERVFRAVDEMACEAGIKMLVEEGPFHGVDLAAVLTRCDGHHHKAMLAYLRHDAVFSVASLFHSVACLPKRYWTRLKGMPRKTPDFSEQATQALANALSEYYRENQARGHRCTVEHYRQGGRQHYFFAYPDDYAQTYISHGEDGTLVRRRQKPAFEVVFVYSPLDGKLDIHAQGDRRLKARLEHIFCSEILGEHPQPGQSCEHTYELNPLLSRAFTFPTDPADGIEEVRVRRMRLSLVGNGCERITLEANPRGPTQGIYDLMEDYLQQKCQSLSVVNVTSVTLVFRLASRGVGGFAKMEFDVSFPDGCSLKSLNDEQRLLGEKYLKRWGIERA